MKETVISLDLRYFVLRVELDKLGVLVGGQHEEILSVQQGVQVKIGLTHRGGLGGVQEGGKVCPKGRTVIPLAEHPVKGSLEVVLLRKLAKIFAEGGVVLIVEVPAAGGGQAGGPAHHHTVGIPDLPHQPPNLLVIRQRLFFGQLIGRAPRGIHAIIPLKIHLGLCDQILVETHIHPFGLMLFLFLLQFILTRACAPVKMLL